MDDKPVIILEELLLFVDFPGATVRSIVGSFEAAKDEFEWVDWYDEKDDILLAVCTDDTCFLMFELPGLLKAVSFRTTSGPPAPVKYDWI